MTDDNQEDFRDELYRPRPVFLILSLIFIVMAVCVYMFDDYILGDDRVRSSMLYLLLLLVCIGCSVGMLMCYRNPKVGNKLLGYSSYDKVREKEKGPAVFSTGINFDSASDEKRINTKRREGRATRRKYAKITREMQSKDDQPNPDGNSNE